MFIETSAILEYFLDGRQALHVEQQLERSSTPKFSAPTVIFEAASVLSARSKIDLETTKFQLLRFLDLFDTTIVPITPEIGLAAIDALARYGKGSGHPAQLNFGDCFSYACCKSVGVPLLYVGDDFAATDLA